MSRQKQGLRTQSENATDRKAQTALDCVQRMNPQLDAKAKRKMVKAILRVIHGNQGLVPRRQITGAQCVDMVWSNSQCVHSRTGKCLTHLGEQLTPRLIFGGRMNILVVDDDEVVLQWVRKQLEARNYDVEDLSSEQGLIIIWSGPTTWDCVLGDYLFIPSTKIHNGLHLVRESGLSTRSNGWRFIPAKKACEHPCPCYISHIGVGCCDSCASP
jgi:CheY-like chemotaxis protein